MISSAQIRAARSLLGLTQEAVANAAGVSIPTLKRAEREGAIQASEKSVSAIRSALEAAGVEFTNGDAPGVRLRPAPKPE